MNEVWRPLEKQGKASESNISISVLCYPPQNKHIDIKKLQLVMLGLFLKDVKTPKNSFSYSSFFSSSSSHIFVKAVSPGAAPRF